MVLKFDQEPKSLQEETKTETAQDEEIKQTHHKMPTMPLMAKRLPFANLAPSEKPSLNTLTEESLRTSKLIQSQMATSIEIKLDAKSPLKQSLVNTRVKFREAARTNQLLDPRIVEKL